MFFTFLQPDPPGPCLLYTSCCEEADQQAVRDFITETNRTLPLYKRMSAVEFSAQPLPRNAMGKLMR